MLMHAWWPCDKDYCGVPVSALYGVSFRPCPLLLPMASAMSGDPCARKSPFCSLTTHWKECVGAGSRINSSEGSAAGQASLACSLANLARLP